MFLKTYAPRLQLWTINRRPLPAFATYPAKQESQNLELGPAHYRWFMLGFWVVSVWFLVGCWC